MFFFLRVAKLGPRRLIWSQEIAGSNPAAQTMTEPRTTAARQYRKWYSTARWARTREAQLMLQPLCERCLAMGIVEEATVVHHADGGHKGSEDKFWFGPFESLCKPHHDGEGKREDLGQRLVRFGADGWPVD